MTVATGTAEALLKPAEAPGDDAPTRAAKRVSDPELVALAELDEIFATLVPGEAERCLYWLSQRYGKNPGVTFSDFVSYLKADLGIK